MARKQIDRKTRVTQIERDVEAYYRSLTVQEKREDKEWAGFASRHFIRKKD